MKFNFLILFFLFNFIQSAEVNEERIFLSPFFLDKVKPDIKKSCLKDEFTEKIIKEFKSLSFQEQLNLIEYLKKVQEKLSVFQFWYSKLFKEISKNKIENLSIAIMVFNNCFNLKFFYKFLIECNTAKNIINSIEKNVEEFLAEAQYDKPKVFIAYISYYFVYWFYEDLLSKEGCGG